MTGSSRLRMAMNEDRLPERAEGSGERAEFERPMPEEEVGSGSGATPFADASTTSGPPAAAPGWMSARRARAGTWWGEASPNLRGSVYMMAALLFYAVMIGLFKQIGTRLPLTQILLIRQIVMSAIILASVGGALPVVMRTRRLGLQVLRGIFTLASMLFGFTAIFHIPLAQATALNFSQVLFVTVAAVLVLKEKVDAARWAATVIGFVGVLVMLDPSSDGLNIYSIVAILGALCGAGITVSVRVLADSERTETILLYQGIVLIAFCAPFALYYWVWPSGEEWLWLLGLSLFGTAGQWLITRAYQVGEAAALAPLDFSRLLLASFTGYVFFAEVPSLSTFLGAVIIIGATLYTMRRNARKRLVIAVPPPA